jgi:hypothetical protein
VPKDEAKPSRWPVEIIMPNKKKDKDWTPSAPQEKSGD